MEFTLGGRDLLRIKGGVNGILLHCLNGTVWLTKGDGIDYLVHGGDRFRLESAATAVVEALGSAELRVEAPECEAAGAGPILSLVACRGNLAGQAG